MLAPAALFALIRGLPPRRAGWTGAAFGAGLFAFGTYWLYTCLHVFGLVPVWLTLVLQTALIAIDGMLPGGAVLPGKSLLAQRPAPTRDWLVLPVLWVLLEWLRGWLLSGFPVAVAGLRDDRLAAQGLGAAVRRLRGDLGRGRDCRGHQRGAGAGAAVGAARPSLAASR